MTSAAVRDPLPDDLITPQNAAFLPVAPSPTSTAAGSSPSLFAGSSAPTRAATPTRPTWSLVTRPFPRDHGHPR